MVMQSTISKEKLLTFSHEYKKISRPQKDRTVTGLSYSEQSTEPLMVVCLESLNDNSSAYAIVSSLKENGNRDWVRTELSHDVDSDTLRSKQEASFGDPSESYCKVIVESDVKPLSSKGGAR
jgi:hypothetical protein